VPKAIEGRRIVLDDRDRRALVTKLFEVAAEHRWNLLAWSVLDTHLHLVAETLEPNLGVGMKRLLGAHARRFHLRHGGAGPLFVPRFWSKRILNGNQLLQTALYVDLNPVAAGLASHPEHYDWCSYGERRSWLVGLVGETLEEATASYAEIVEEACRRLRSGRRRLPDVVGSACDRAAGRAASG